MYFKNSEYLPFYLLVLIPIIIHFLRFSRYTEFYYSNVNFIKNILNENKKYREIKDILLLIIRTLFIFLLVSIFTQPYFLKNENIDSSNKEDSLIVYFDNDLSTNFISEDNNSILDKSKSDIISLIENNLFNPKNIIVISNNNSNIFKDKESAKKEIINLKPYYKKVTLEEIYQKIQLSFNLVPYTNKKLILISTKNNNFKPEKSDINISYLKYKPKSIENVLIKDIFFYDNYSQKEIKIIVESTQKINTTLKLYIYQDENYSLMNTKSINIKNGTDTISFFLEIGENTKYLSGKVVIDDNLSKLNFDDDFFFTLNKKSSKSISLIQNKEPLENVFVSKVFKDNSVIFKSYKKTNLNISEIRKSNIIIYDEILNYDYNFIKEIDNFLEDGKTVILIPNINSEIENLNNITANFNICNIENIKTEKYFIEDINYKHKFFNNVFSKKLDGNLHFPFAKNHFVTKNISSDILASFSNKNPAFFYKKIKNGNLLFFTFPFNKENSDIYDHSLIFPFLYKNLDFSKNQNIYATIGEDYNQYFSEENITNKFSIFLKINTHKIIPDFNVNSAGEIKISTSFLPEEKGIYSVLIDEKKLGEISYNFPRNYNSFSENDTYRIDNIEDVKILFSNELKNNISNGKILIFICLFLLLSETFLIHKKQSKL